MRPGQRDLVENLLPKLEVDPVSTDIFDPITGFGPDLDDVWLEIGFGGGEHLAWQQRLTLEQYYRMRTIH